MFRTVLSRLVFGVALGLAGLQSHAEVEVVAIDFGMSPAPSCGESPLYTGTFDGSDGFVAMNLSDCGTVESPALDLGGGVTLQFTNVSGWNNTDGVPADVTQALTGDHFFSSANGADDPVSFSVSGLDAADILILEFVDRRGGETALVTFEGATTLVSSDELGRFTDVSGGGVTGRSVYQGSFTGASGSGEGNLAGARVTIIRPDAAPCVGDFNGDGTVGGADFGTLLAAWGACKGCSEDLDVDGMVGGSDVGLLLATWGDCPGGGGPVGACCLGETCWQIGEADCIAAGGLYLGDDTSCAKTECEEPTKGDCCETGLVPGCLDAVCSNAVCLVLPDCCEVLWDENCAMLAQEVCNDCDGTTDFNSFAIDFGQAPGCGPSPVFTGTFDGSSGFIGMTLSDCGVVESPSIDLGQGLTLTFTNVSGWNNTDGFPANEVPALTGDHFFSSALGADDPVNFQVGGLDPADVLVLEFLDRRGSETALVTFEGTTTLVDRESVGAFTDVSDGGVTGSSDYFGSFTNEGGVGEGNLAGARIGVIRSGDGPVGACCLGEACWQVGETACLALGGTYAGDGIPCGGDACGPSCVDDIGDCDTPQDTPGCECTECETIVCNIDSVCCDVIWDEVCVQIAEQNCLP